MVAFCVRDAGNEEEEEVRKTGATRVISVRTHGGKGGGWNGQMTLKQ